MALSSSTTVSGSTVNYETEFPCSTVDIYYVDRLFFGVESNDLTVIKSFTNEHLLQLCRIRRVFDSQWLAPSKEKQTAYQRACFLGHTGIVQYMLEAGVRIDQLFSPANTRNVERGAFMFACQSGSLVTIRLLLQALSSDSIEHYQSRNRSARCSTSFVRQYLIPQRNETETLFSVENGLESVFPIHFAIARNDVEMARQLVISANGQLDTVNDWKPFRRGGFTPLHLACLFDRSLTMIKLLLSFSEAYVDPILQTSQQGTFADQMTTAQEVIEYLRPKRLSITNVEEHQHLKSMEEMESGRPYQIYIKPLSGQTIPLAVTGQTTLSEIGAYLENEWNLPRLKQRLVFNGRHIHTCPEIVTETRLPLIHYHIKKDSVLHIMWHNPK